MISPTCSHAEHPSLELTRDDVPKALLNYATQALQIPDARAVLRQASVTVCERGEANRLQALFKLNLSFVFQSVEGKGFEERTACLDLHSLVWQPWKILWPCFTDNMVSEPWRLYRTMQEHNETATSWQQLALKQWQPADLSTEEIEQAKTFVQEHIFKAATERLWPGRVKIDTVLRQRRDPSTLPEARLLHYLGHRTEQCKSLGFFRFHHWLRVRTGTYKSPLHGVLDVDTCCC